MTAPRRFRWGQFSIRSVLLLTFGVACYFGGWAARQWQSEREMEAARKAAEAEMAATTAAMQQVLTAPPGLPPGYPGLGAGSDAAPAIGEYGIGTGQPPTLGPEPVGAVD